jgi:hypothetical protein
MDLGLLKRRSDFEWEIPRQGAMRVPAVIYASEALMRDMDRKVHEQAVNVATLPGIVKASYAMPDAHWGYGFPIGGVAAFDPEAGGVVSASAARARSTWARPRWMRCSPAARSGRCSAAGACPRTSSASRSGDR